MQSRSETFGRALPTSADTPRRPAVPLAERLAALNLPPLVVFEADITFGCDLRFQSPVCHVVRGLLGERLRRTCRTGAPDCRGCEVWSECTYDRLFGSEGGGQRRGHGLEGVQPYWLQGLPVDVAVKSGSTWPARLVAAALDDADLDLLHGAWRQALTSLGRGVRPLYAPRLSASRRERIEWGSKPEESGTWWIEARTPLLLSAPRHTSHLAECPQAPWLPVLLAAGIRRLEALAMLGGTALDRVPVVQPDLRGVEVLAGGLEPWRGAVLSRRQGGIPIHEGYVGRALLRFPSPTGGIASLLRRLALTGVGKKTTMGFGDVRVCSE